MEHYSGQTEIRGQLHRGVRAKWNTTPVKLRSGASYTEVRGLHRGEGEVEHYSGQTEIRGQLHRGTRAKWNTTPVKLRSEVSYTEA